MLTIVPFVPGMLQAKTSRTFGAEFVELRADDPYMYWRLIKDLFRHGDDFCIIEQDIVISEAQLDELETCPELWCVYGYNRGTANFTALGTLRLRRHIMQEWPHLLSLETPQDVYFDQCDGTLYSRLAAAGLKAHRHYPDVGHEQSATRVLGNWRICREPIEPATSSTGPERGEWWEPRKHALA
jgi:hypothetical protein